MARQTAILSLLLTLLATLSAFGEVDVWPIRGGAVPGISEIAGPGAIAVPAGDADGTYTVSWGSSVATGVTYLLEEATDPIFSTNLRTVYNGTETSVDLAGRENSTTYFYRVKALKPGYRDSGWVGWSGSYSCAVPGWSKVPHPSGMNVPDAAAVGTYTVSWGASPLAGVTYLVQEATNASFSAGLRTVYYGSGLSITVTDRPTNTTYYYRVRAFKPGLLDSGWIGWNGIYACAVPGVEAAAPPQTMSVPVSSPSGSYAISWDASTTPDVTYLVHEATDPIFSANLHTTYIGNAQSVSLTGRTANSTYFYRAKAMKPGYRDSGWVGGNGSYSCAVPGTATTAQPGAISLPASSPIGNYTISWRPSASTGVTYLLQEAEDPIFSNSLRTAYYGPGILAFVTDRPLNATYYYRIKAMKPGYKESSWTGWTGSYSCAVPGTAAVITPGPLEVPSFDPDGNFTVNWYASPNGTNYFVQEATNPIFTSGLRTVYFGPDLSTDITGSSTDTTYYYRLKAVSPGYRDSGWDGWSGSHYCAVPGLATAPAPGALTIPSGDPDGAYVISWSAAPIPGASYLVQEAQEPTFTTALRTAYYGTGLSANITGRALGIEYYYRISTIKPGYLPSEWYISSIGCRVPGTVLSAPSTIILPAHDPDGTYAVSWTASSTSGCAYLLEEATDPGFTVGLRTAYYSTGLSTTISGRAAGKTYYYRVKAIKRGYLDSNWTISPSGCAVP